jgi:hypothetical protein
MASTRIGAVSAHVISGEMRLKIFIAFGMEILGHTWASSDEAYAIADWLDTQGRDLGAKIIRAMLGESVPVEKIDRFGRADWFGVWEGRQVESRAVAPRE